MTAATEGGRVAHWLSGKRTKSATAPTADEVQGFRTAQGLSFRCAQAAAAELRPGWTEGQTQRWMLNWLRDHGVRAHLHKPIVAFGERTLAPGAQWGPARGEGRTLGESDVAILDCAPILDGFTGDIAYTVSVGPNPELERAQQFLSDLRAQLPERFADPETARDVFAWVDGQIRDAGYENAVNGYVGHVLGHRVYRHGKFFTWFPWFPPERPFGWIASWHGPGFMLAVTRRFIYPEELGPLHHGPKTGIWAVEPHLRLDRFGCKFEELLVVEDGRAYWLDDISQKRMVIQP